MSEEVGKLRKRNKFLEKRITELTRAKERRFIVPKYLIEEFLKDDVK